MTLDTVADESRKKMADGVATSSKKMADGVTRSPARLCTRDGKICYSMDALSTIFLLFLCLASYFFYFLLPYTRYRGMFISFVLRLRSSHLLLLILYVLSALHSTCSFCHLYPASSRNSLFVYLIPSIFLVVLISRVAVFVVLSYPVR